MVGTNIATASSTPKMPYSRRRDFFVQQMHARTSSRRCRRSQSSASRSGGKRRREAGRQPSVRSVVCGHGRWTIRKSAGSRKRFQEFQKQIFPALQCRQRNPFVRRVRLRNVARTEHHARNAARRQHRRVAKEIDARRAVVWPTLRRNCRTSGSFGFVSNGSAGASLALEIFAHNFFARRNAAISRRTPASVSPGNVRRSIVMVQRSGTMFGCVPPEIVPTFTVAVPSSGCLRFRNCAA